MLTIIPAAGNICKCGPIYAGSMIKILATVGEVPGIGLKPFDAYAGAFSTLAPVPRQLREGDTGGAEE